MSLDYLSTACTGNWEEQGGANSPWNQERKMLAEILWWQECCCGADNTGSAWDACLPFGFISLPLNLNVLVLYPLFLNKDWFLSFLQMTAELKPFLGISHPLGEKNSGAWSLQEPSCMVPSNRNPALTTHTLRRVLTATTDCIPGPQGKKKEIIHNILLWQWLIPRHGEAFIWSSSTDISVEREETEPVSTHAPSQETVKCK